MIDFYIKEDLVSSNLELISKEILNVNDLFLISSDKFTPENNEYYHFDEFKVICVYQSCKGDVSLLINVVDGDILDNEKIKDNLKNVAKKHGLSFYCPDDEDMDMGAFVYYSPDGKVKRNYEIREDEDESIYFTSL